MITRKLLSMLLILHAVGTYAQVHHFESYTSFSGLSALTSGHGAIVGDMDADGFEDVFIPGQTQPNMLLKNMGDSTFTNVIASSGIAIQGYAYTACWADIDNDGDLDLFVGNFSNQFFSYSNQLYLNEGNGQFTDISYEAGIGTLMGTRSVLAADIDSDGFTDFYICSSAGQNTMWKNNGDLTFTDVTISSGTADPQISMGAIFFDYDNDGDQDLYVTHDANQANKLFQNDGTGHFIDLSFSSGLGLAAMGMGVDHADVNNDGWLDVYVTNLGPNFLFINNQDGTFTEQAIASGAIGQGMGWGCFFLDQDNDADHDIYVINQYNFAPYPNYLYDNDGSATFIDVAAGSLLQSTNNGFGGTCFDMDNDGYQDIIIANIGDTLLELFLNGTQENHWISFVLEGTVSAHDAFGTRVSVYAGSESYISEKKSASSYSAQGSHRVHFGLGEITLVDSVIIRFPSGIVNILYELPVNRMYTVIENEDESQIDCIPSADFNYEILEDNEVLISAYGDEDILEWEFQSMDSSLFTGPSGSIVFPGEGEYEVCLTVFNSCSFNEICQIIEIECLTPMAFYEYELEGLDLSIIGTYDHVDSLYWDFGDGLGTGALNPQHNYALQGEYQLCLSVFNACGSDLICDTLQVICPLPQPDFGVSVEGLNAIFQVVSLDYDSVLWSFGDGNESDVFQVQHSYANEGEYQVCLTVYDLCGMSTYCDTLLLDDMINAISWEEKKAPFHIYPNPAQDVLYLDILEMNLDQVSLISIDGKEIPLVFDQNDKLVLIHLQSIQNGTYILIVKTSEAKTYQELLILR